MVTTMGNGMVLHAIRTEKRLQTVSNMFIMSLAVADLIVGLIVMPISAIDFIADSGQGKFLSKQAGTELYQAQHKLVEKNS